MQTTDYVTKQQKRLSYSMHVYVCYTIYVTINATFLTTSSNTLSVTVYQMPFD